MTYWRQNLMFSARARSRCNHSARSGVSSLAAAPPGRQGPPGPPPHSRTGAEAAVLAPVLGGDIRAEAGSAEPRVPAQLLVQLHHLLCDQGDLWGVTGWQGETVQGGEDQGMVGCKGQEGARGIRKVLGHSLG